MYALSSFHFTGTRSKQRKGPGGEIRERLVSYVCLPRKLGGKESTQLRVLRNLRFFCWIVKITSTRIKTFFFMSPNLNICINSYLVLLGSRRKIFFKRNTRILFGNQCKDGNKLLHSYNALTVPSSATINTRCNSISIDVKNKPVEF